MLAGNYVIICGMNRHIYWSIFRRIFICKENITLHRVATMCYNVVQPSFILYKYRTNHYYVDVTEAIKVPFEFQMTLIGLFFQMLPNTHVLDLLVFRMPCYHIPFVKQYRDIELNGSSQILQWEHRHAIWKLTRNLGAISIGYSKLQPKPLNNNNCTPIE